MSALTQTKNNDIAPLSCGRPVAYAQSMNANSDDSALMLRYRDGDVAAFETLYKRHKDPLFRYLVRLSASKDTAEDVFQEVWGKIIKARANYQQTAKFSTFLYRVAHNCFIDHVRRNKRHRHTHAVDVDSQVSSRDEPEVATEKSLARRKLLIALKSLPQEQRDVFLLYEEAGLTIGAIAKVVGANHETAKSRLRYANQKLKASLNTSDNATDHLE